MQPRVDLAIFGHTNISSAAAAAVPAAHVEDDEVDAHVSGTRRRYLIFKLAPIQCAVCDQGTEQVGL